MTSITRIEADCFQVAKHLVREVIPVILNKYKKPVDLPILMHYRCRTLLHNLSLNWLFAMHLPDDVRLNFIDLLKTRGSSGLWDIYFAGCGQIQSHSYEIKEHIGAGRDKRFTNIHSPVVQEVLQEFEFSIAPFNIAWLPRYSKEYSDIWDTCIPQPYRNCKERFEVYRWLTIYKHCFQKFPQAGNLNWVTRFRTTQRKKGLAWSFMKVTSARIKYNV